jgi:hypothetical protein
MNYSEYIEKLKEENKHNQSINEKDFNQPDSWHRYIPEEMQRIWNEIPLESRLLIYEVAGLAYRYR